MFAQKKREIFQIVTAVFIIAIGFFAAFSPAAAEGEAAKPTADAKITKPADPKAQAKDLLQRADEMVKNGQCEAALPLLNKARGLDPQLEDVWLLTGTSYLYLKKAPQAVSLFAKAVKVLPDSPSIWYSYGYALGKSGNYKSSIGPFNRAIKLSPNFADAWKYKGYALVKIGRLPEAVPVLEKALTLAPEDNRLRLILGISTYETGMKEKGIELVKAALAKDPKIKNEIPDDLKKVIGI